MPSLGGKGHRSGDRFEPVLGYERSSSIAKETLKTDVSVYDLVLEKGWITIEKLDDMLRPENMTDPREIPK